MEQDRTQLPSINQWGNGIEGNNNPTTINLRKQKHKSPIKPSIYGNIEKDNDHPNLQT